MADLVAVRSGLPTPRRLLAAYGWLLAGAVIAAVLGAGGWLSTRPTTFTSEASLLVGPHVYSNGASEPADMGTERAVATSGAVTSAAAERLGLAEDVVDRAVGARVPVDTHVLIVAATGPSAVEARRRAAALADAYLSYRHQPILPSPDRPGGRPSQDVQVITPASRPLGPDSSDVVLVLVVAVLLGASLGTAAALLIDAGSDRLRGVEDVERLSGLPVLARVRAAVDSTRGVATLHEPWSAEVDAYHRLRASLTVGRRQRQVILLTSGRRFDGVTAVAANLAVAIAESGVKAQLVLADPQGPHPDDLFPATAVPGLTVKDVAGQDSVALRRGGDIARAIVGAGQETVVVVAAPALLTHAGALTVADLAHGILLVVHDHRSRRTELLRSLDQLAAVSDKVHVAVVGARAGRSVARWRTPRGGPVSDRREPEAPDETASTGSSA